MRLDSFNPNSELDLNEVIAPIEEVEFFIKLITENKEKNEKNWELTKQAYEIKDDTAFQELNERLVAAQNYTPTASRIHPKNTNPNSHDKQEFSLLTKEEVERVHFNTKKKLTFPKYSVLNENEKESLLKIELMRALEKKKKLSLEVIFKSYDENSLIIKEGKKVLKEVEENLQNLERQELRLLKLEKDKFSTFIKNIFDKN